MSTQLPIDWWSSIEQPWLTEVSFAVRKFGLEMSASEMSTELGIGTRMLKLLKLQE